MSGVQILRVGEDEGEQRLDRWLKKRFPQLNQIAIEKLCRTGQIRVDGGRVKPAAPGAGRNEREHQDGRQIGQHRHDLRRHADAAHALDVELEDADPAEKVRSSQQPQGPPRGEHDQRQGDPAAPRRRLRERTVPVVRSMG